MLERGVELELAGACYLELADDLRARLATGHARLLDLQPPALQQRRAGDLEARVGERHPVAL